MAESNVVDLYAARRKRWIRTVEQFRESGEVFTSADFTPEYDEPAVVIEFPLERSIGLAAINGSDSEFPGA